MCGRWRAESQHFGNKARRIVRRTQAAPQGFAGVGKLVLTSGGGESFGLFSPAFHQASVVRYRHKSHLCPPAGRPEFLRNQPRHPAISG